MFPIALSISVRRQSKEAALGFSNKRFQKSLWLKWTKVCFSLIFCVVMGWQGALIPRFTRESWMMGLDSGSRWSLCPRGMGLWKIEAWKWHMLLLTTQIPNHMALLSHRGTERQSYPVRVEWRARSDRWRALVKALFGYHTHSLRWGEPMLPLKRTVRLREKTVSQVHGQKGNRIFL